MVVVCAFALGVVFTTYLVVGAVLDLYRWRTRKLTDRATSLFGIALYEPYSEIGHAVDSLQMLPKRVVLAVALRLSLDLDAEIQRRLVDVVATTGLTRRIRRLSRSGRWRRRQRAGRLAHLLEHDSPVRSRLLADRNAQVRAAVIESLSAEHAAAHVESLLAMLDAPEFAVEYVAEEALLRSDGRIIPDLARHLREATGDGVLHALEVAATVRDPRLFEAISIHRTSRDPRMRRLVAHSLSAGSVLQGLPVLLRLLEDPEPRVRIAAIEGVARLRIEVLAGRVGTRLADEAWDVRRHAGLALQQLGAAGIAVLRHALDSPDRFARDMARQVLDALHASGRIQPVPSPSDVKSLDQWYPSEAAA